MPRLEWDKVGERVFETGVDRGVLYIPNVGVYDNGVAWNGLTTVTEAPSGAESSPQYADNIKYLNLVSAEEFGATIEAFTYPSEFAQFDGTVVLNNGVSLGQQSRKSFGLAYRTRVGNDVSGTDLGYKLHMVYGCQAAPSERAYATINDSPEALTFSWELSTTAVAVTNQKPSALLTVDSTKVTAANLTALENALYGTAGSNPRLPLPDEIVGMFAGALTLVRPQDPTFATATGVITIPTQTGVVYRVDGIVRTTSYTIPTSGASAVVKATPATGFTFPNPVQDTWVYTRA